MQIVSNNFMQIVSNDISYTIARGPSEDSDQPAHPRSMIRVFAGRSVGSQGSKASSARQRGFWSDCVDTHADLSPRWAQEMLCPLLYRAAGEGLGLTNQYILVLLCRKQSLFFLFVFFVLFFFCCCFFFFVVVVVVFVFVFVLFFFQDFFLTISWAENLHEKKKKT